MGTITSYYNETVTVVVYCIASKSAIHFPCIVIQEMNAIIRALGMCLNSAVLLKLSLLSISFSSFIDCNCFLLINTAWFTISFLSPKSPWKDLKLKPAALCEHWCYNVSKYIFRCTLSNFCWKRNVRFLWKNAIQQFSTKYFSNFSLICRITFLLCKWRYSIWNSVSLFFDQEFWIASIIDWEIESSFSLIEKSSERIKLSSLKRNE